MQLTHLFDVTIGSISDAVKMCSADSRHLEYETEVRLRHSVHEAKAR